MTERRNAVLAAIVGLLSWVGASASADTVPSTRPEVPGTTLEAQARDDGTSMARWLVGSGVAAAAAVVVGGTILRRRMP